MARVAMVLDRDFEDRDFKTLVEWLRAAGHEVVLVGPRRLKEEDVLGRRHEVHARVDLTPSEARADELDGMIIPAGYPPSQLLSKENLLNLIRDVYASGKPVGAESTAGWILMEPDRTHGSHLITWPAVKRD